MNILKNILFGLVSGIAGFLPVSASAHQNLYCMMTGMEANPLLLLFVHFGCLLAVIIHYFKRLKHMQRETRIAGAKKHRRMRQPDMAAVSDSRMLITASVPIILITLLGKGFASRLTQLWLISVLLLINGFLLYGLQFVPAGQKDSRSMSPMDGVLYGICEALSILPGVSGISFVLMVGQSRGGDRSYVLDQAILLMIPCLIAAMVLDFVGIVSIGAISFLIFIGAVLAAAAAFAGAYGAIALLRYLAVRIGFHSFAYYSLGAGLVCLIFYLMI